MTKSLWMFIFILISCNKKDEKNVLTVSEPPRPGVYQLCQSENGISIKEVLFLSQNSLKSVVTLYGAINCQVGTEDFEETHSFSIASIGGIAHVLDYESLVFKPIDASVVSALNSDSMCGFTDWSANQPKNGLGISCDGTTISRGQRTSVSMYKSGSGLTITENGERAAYSLVKSLDFKSEGQVLANGSYHFYDGTIGIFLTLTSPNFQMIYYDDSTLRYYTKSGTYTSANNQAVLTWTSSTPAGCNSEATPVTRRFMASSISLGLESLSTADWLFEKTSLTNTQFRDVYLRPGYSQGCF